MGNRKGNPVVPANPRVRSGEPGDSCPVLVFNFQGTWSSCHIPQGSNPKSFIAMLWLCKELLTTRWTIGCHVHLAHRNRSDFCDLRLRCPSRTAEIARFPRQETAMMHCDLRVRWKVASDLRFRAAISEPKTPSCCGISGDLAPSTRKSLAIAIVRFWCAKHVHVSLSPCQWQLSWHQNFLSMPCCQQQQKRKVSSTTYNNNYWCRPGSTEPSPSGRQRHPHVDSAAIEPTVNMGCAWGQHNTTKRRKHDSHQMSSRHLSFNMVAELRINNWATNSESVQDNQINDIRISAGQLGNDISPQRPGGPQGGHRGGTAGNDISSASVVFSFGSTSSSHHLSMQHSENKSSISSNISSSSSSSRSSSPQQQQLQLPSKPPGGGG